MISIHDPLDEVREILVGRIVSSIVPAWSLLPPLVPISSRTLMTSMTSLITISLPPSLSSVCTIIELPGRRWNHTSPRILLGPLELLDLEEILLLVE